LARTDRAASYPKWRIAVSGSVTHFAVRGDTHGMSPPGGTELPKALAAECLQLAEADLDTSAQLVLVSPLHQERGLTPSPTCHPGQGGSAQAGCGHPATKQESRMTVLFCSDASRVRRRAHDIGGPDVHPRIRLQGRHLPLGARPPTLVWPPEGPPGCLPLCLTRCKGGRCACSEEKLR
jgi:hypothetical protein